MLSAKRRILFGLAVLATVALAASGCEILFWTAIDPHGLPCRTPTADDPRVCAEGYTCLDGLCVTAAKKGEGESCTIDDECENYQDIQMKCRDHFELEKCEANDYDINCSVGRSSPGNNTGRACRRPCNPTEPSEGQCAPGYVCWLDEDGAPGLGGYCQPGVCIADADCGSGNLCVGREDNEDPNGELKNGKCFRGCDPLQCNPSSGCVGCPVEDLNGDDIDDILGCEPTETNDLRRVACVISGTVPYRSPCGGVDLCQPGSFCASRNEGEQTICIPYCFVSAPACNVGESCQSVDGNFGYCL